MHTMQPEPKASFFYCNCSTVCLLFTVGFPLTNNYDHSSFCSHLITSNSIFRSAAVYSSCDRHSSHTTKCRQADLVVGDGLQVGHHPRSIHSRHSWVPVVECSVHCAVHHQKSASCDLSEEQELRWGSSVDHWRGWGVGKTAGHEDGTTEGCGCFVGY